MFYSMDSLRTEAQKTDFEGLLQGGEGGTRIYKSSNKQKVA